MNYCENEIIVYCSRELRPKYLNIFATTFFANVFFCSDGNENDLVDRVMKSNIVPQLIVYHNLAPDQIPQAFEGVLFIENNSSMPIDIVSKIFEMAESVDPSRSGFWYGVCGRVNGRKRF